MELLHEFPTGEAGGPGSVVTIGSFDGVHIGHQRLLQRVRTAGARRNLTTVAVTFDPHPRCVVDPSGCPALLSSLDDRVELIGRAGVDRVVVIPFTRELSTWSADRFAATLTESLGMRRLIVGPGFALGHGREGNLQFLGRLGVRRGFRVTTVAPSRRCGLPVSSGRIRAAIAAGSFSEAISMLGRPYMLEGLVVRGEGRGAGLGVPTANVDVDASRCIPAPGVYAGWLHFGDGWRPAATGIGTRPTFGGTAVTIEAYVLDFDGDLYGRRVRLALARRIRSERAFNSIAALTTAMARDITHTREILRRRSPPT
jgi:riboflavin kinase / FMN adenylyltransferase